MKKRLFIIILVFFVVLFITIFIKNNYKKIKFGNNENNKSVKEIEKYILSINSYRATMEVTINSNKNSNKYVIKQEWNMKNNTSKQTVIEPQNIEGLEIINKDGCVEVKNSKLNLSEMYKEYPHISENILWLNAFINEYKNGVPKENMANIYEEQNFIVMEVKEEKNKYFSSAKLYLDKKTALPKRMVIQGDDKKDAIYILYNEIIINN